MIGLNESFVCFYFFKKKKRGKQSCMGGVAGCQYKSIEDFKGLKQFLIQDIVMSLDFIFLSVILSIFNYNVD